MTDTNGEHQMTTIKDDFTLWYKARNDDPDDFVSLHPHNERAVQWCRENNVDPVTDLGITNDQADQLRARLEAQGFKVGGCS